MVLCNEWLLDRFDDPQQPGNGPGAVAALARDVERLEDTLRTHWVPNPFFYPTEQALYERALAETGIVIRRGKAEDLLRKLKTGLELARERQRARFEANVAGLLEELAVLSLDPLLVDSAPALQQTVRWLAGFDPRHVGHALTIRAASSWAQRFSSGSDPSVTPTAPRTSLAERLRQHRQAPESVDDFSTEEAQSQHHARASRGPVTGCANADGGYPGRPASDLAGSPRRDGVEQERPAHRPHRHPADGHG